MIDSVLPGPLSCQCLNAYVHLCYLKHFKAKYFTRRRVVFFYKQRPSPVLIDSSFELCDPTPLRALSKGTNSLSTVSFPHPSLVDATEHFVLGDNYKMRWSNCGLWYSLVQRVMNFNSLLTSWNVISKDSLQ